MPDLRRDAIGSRNADDEPADLCRPLYLRLEAVRLSLIRPCSIDRAETPL